MWNTTGIQFLEIGCQNHVRENETYGPIWIRLTCVQLDIKGSNAWFNNDQSDIPLQGSRA